MDAGFFAVLKHRAKRRLHRAEQQLGEELSLAQIEHCLMLALADSLPVLPSFWRKAGLVSSATAVTLGKEERLPQQPALTSRLPFGEPPEGSDFKSVSGAKAADRAGELPWRPFPGSGSSVHIDDSDILLTQLGVPLVRVEPAKASDGWARSLSGCAAMRNNSTAAVLSDRAALEQQATKLQSQLRLPRKAASSSAVLAAAAAAWKTTIRVYEQRSAGTGPRLAHTRSVAWL